MDVSVTAAALSNSIAVAQVALAGLTASAQAVSQTAQVAVSGAVNMATVSLGQVAAIMAGLGITGIALEQGLEKFGIDKAPQALKPYIPVIVGIGGVTAAGLAKGLPWQQALGLGIGTYVASQLKHDHAPAVTPDGQAGPVVAPGAPPAHGSNQ